MFEIVKEELRKKKLVRLIEFHLFKITVSQYSYGAEAEQKEFEDHSVS